MSELSKTTSRSVLKITADHHVWEDDEIVTEYPLTIFLNEEEFATIVCTPADLEEMVVGFLAAEGAIQSFAEIKQITIDEAKGIAYVDLHKATILSQSFYSKRRITSCCGKSLSNLFTFSAMPARQSLPAAPLPSLQISASGSWRTCKPPLTSIGKREACTMRPSARLNKSCCSIQISAATTPWTKYTENACGKTSPRPTKFSCSAAACRLKFC